MDTTTINAQSLQVEFNGAPDGFDFKALAQTAISYAADRENELAATQTQLNEALGQVSELGSKLDLQEKTKDLPGIVVSVNGGNLMLIGKRFRINRQEYTADQVAKDPALLQLLADKKSGSLIPVPADGSTSNTAS